MMAQITGKTVVVTGASRGLGLEFVKQLADKGNIVIATARAPQKAFKLQELVSKHPKSVIVTSLDVSSQDSIKEWTSTLAADIQHVDYLINNAGVTDDWLDFHHITAQSMVHCFLTNTVGPLLVCQGMYKAGLLGPPGSVVANITSKMGSIDDNGSGGDYAYRASKCALNMVNKSMSIDLAGDGITSVLLHPGYVRTDMTDWAGLIDADECIRGLLAVLEGGQPLNGMWYDYKGNVVPW